VAPNCVALAIGPYFSQDATMQEQRTRHVVPPHRLRRRRRRALSRGSCCRERAWRAGERGGRGGRRGQTQQGERQADRPHEPWPQALFRSIARLWHRLWHAPLWHARTPRNATPPPRTATRRGLGFLARGCSGWWWWWRCFGHAQTCRVAPRRGAPAPRRPRAEGLGCARCCWAGPVD